MIYLYYGKFLTVLILKTGYYCVGIVPINTKTATNQDEAITTYSSIIDFENVFKGFLPSSEYPKIPVCAIFFLFEHIKMIKVRLCFHSSISD